MAQLQALGNGVLDALFELAGKVSDYLLNVLPANIADTQGYEQMREDAAQDEANVTGTLSGISEWVQEKTDTDTVTKLRFVRDFGKELEDNVQDPYKQALKKVVDAVDKVINVIDTLSGFSESAGDLLSAFGDFDSIGTTLKLLLNQLLNDRSQFAANLQDMQVQGQAVMDDLVTKALGLPAALKDSLRKQVDQAFDEAWYRLVPRFLPDAVDELGAIMTSIISSTETAVMLVNTSGPLAHVLKLPKNATGICHQPAFGSNQLDDLLFVFDVSGAMMAAGGLSEVVASQCGEQCTLAQMDACTSDSACAQTFLASLQAARVAVSTLDGDLGMTNRLIESVDRHGGRAYDVAALADQYLPHLEALSAWGRVLGGQAGSGDEFSASIEDQLQRAWCFENHVIGGSQPSWSTGCEEHSLSRLRHRALSSSGPLSFRQGFFKQAVTFAQTAQSSVQTTLTTVLARVDHIFDQLGELKTSAQDFIMNSLGPFRQLLADAGAFISAMTSSSPAALVGTVIDATVRIRQTAVQLRAQTDEGSSESGTSIEEVAGTAINAMCGGPYEWDGVTAGFDSLSVAFGKFFDGLSLKRLGGIPANVISVITESVCFVRRTGLRIDMSLEDLVNDLWAIVGALSVGSWDDPVDRPCSHPPYCMDTVERSTWVWRTLQFPVRHLRFWDLASPPLTSLCGSDEQIAYKFTPPGMMSTWSLQSSTFLRDTNGGSGTACPRFEHLLAYGSYGIDDHGNEVRPAALVITDDEGAFRRLHLLHESSGQPWHGSLTGLTLNEQYIWACGRQYVPGSEGRRYTGDWEVLQISGIERDGETSDPLNVAIARKINSGLSTAGQPGYQRCILQWDTYKEYMWVGGDSKLQAYQLNSVGMPFTPRRVIHLDRSVTGFAFYYDMFAHAYLALTVCNLRGKRSDNCELQFHRRTTLHWQSWDDSLPVYISQDEESDDNFFTARIPQGSGSLATSTTVGGLGYNVYLSTATLGMTAENIQHSRREDLDKEDRLFTFRPPIMTVSFEKSLDNMQLKIFGADLISPQPILPGFGGGGEVSEGNPGESAYGPDAYERRLHEETSEGSGNPFGRRLHAFLVGNYASDGRRLFGAAMAEAQRQPTSLDESNYAEPDWGEHESALGAREGECSVEDEENNGPCLCMKRAVVPDHVMKPFFGVMGAPHHDIDGFGFCVYVWGPLQVCGAVTVHLVFHTDIRAAMCLQARTIKTALVPGVTLKLMVDIMARVQAVFQIGLGVAAYMLTLELEPALIIHLKSGFAVTGQLWVVQRAIRICLKAFVETMWLKWCCKWGFCIPCGFDWKTWLDWEFVCLNLGNGQRWPLLPLVNSGEGDSTPPEMAVGYMRQMNQTHCTFQFPGFFEEETEIM